MINIQRLLAGVDLVELINRNGIELKRRGAEFVGLCPFHGERSPSFTVVPTKGFVHCFGCGVTYDAIGFLMALHKYDFTTACHKLGGHDYAGEAKQAVRSAPRKVTETGEVWVPIYPVPETAPRWEPGVRGDVWSINRSRWWRGCEPARADAYHDAGGALMGYVLRVDMPDGKITPPITWCIGPDGSARWCLQGFPEPRPMFGLQRLAAMPEAPVLLVEGEKACMAGASALPMYACASWPGGSKAVRFTDFSALAGRDVVLWPDADPGGIGAMLGYVDGSGLLHEGVAQLAHRAGCASLRVVDVAGMPKGWDLADGLADGWTPKQLAGWAKSRVKVVEMQMTDRAAV